ncbi:tyrosine-type recombinase/integrase [Halomonas sp. 25-S5]|uniref:tyrosine-type recombinase/integrase n=1 Tax=Halomonas sp. 25-S5 TaxID=2994065 RepID=UPI002469317E|nr:tyrosine-type recombinase/integrase [Halomonas sp. 25-S5]
MKNEEVLELIEPTTYQITSLQSKHALVKFVDIKKLSNGEKRRLQVSVNSLYEDNQWSFHSEFPDNNDSEATLSFEIKLSDGTLLTENSNEIYLEQLKDFYYTMLTDPVSSRPKFSTYKRAINRGIKFLVCYMKQARIRTFSDIDKHDAENYLAYVATTRIKSKEQEPITNRTLASRVEGVDWLFEQEPKMKNGLTFNMFEEYGGRIKWSRIAAEKVLGRTESRTIEMPDEVAKKAIECAISDLKIADCLFDIYKIDKKYKNKELGYQDWVCFREEAYRNHGYWSGRIERQKRGTLECQLSAACYVIIALLTGMRLHEILNIQYGNANNWCSEQLEIDGSLLNLYFVKSKTTKLEAKPTRYQWQTVPIVKTALEALEKAHERYHDDGNPWLFPGVKSTARLGKGSVGHRLKIFSARHDIKFKGELWSLASHQFRKKFARIMVRQGLGLKALQDQLKHFDIEMTKLYGDPNLYAELQAEKFILSEELMEEFVGSQVPIIGGGADEINQLRKEFLGMAKKDRLKFLKSLPSQGLVEQTDDGLCFYRAKKALCGGDKSNCRPADCNNSFMVSTGKKKTLIYRKMENDRLIKYFKGKPFKVAYLKERNKEIDKLLNQLKLVEVAQ